jgi:penicillin G amidase
MFTAAALLFAPLWQERTPPSAVTEVTLPDLAQNVEVYRDAAGTPHIFARTSDDLFVAFGYVTAEDRLFQIDHVRRMLAGRLAEVQGPDQLESDRYYRTIALEQLSRDILAGTDAETRRALERFADGINHYIAQHRDDLPVEFGRLGYAPSPWQAADSILVFKALGHTIDVSRWRAKIALADAVAHLGARARDLFPAYSPHAPTIIKPGEMPATRSNDGPRQGWGLIGPDQSLGSNNWVVSGAKSVTGKPMLAADPHYRITAPPFWYEASLHGGGYDYSGIAIAGSPFMLFGQNADIAWSITAAFIDSVDVYEERLDDLGTSADYMGTREALRVADEVIHVKGGPSVTERVRWTRHGPLVTRFAQGARGEYALRWTDHERKGDEMAALRLVSRAKDWDAFVGAFRGYNTMTVNVLYADRRGNIGYTLAGAIPMRPAGPAHAAVPGWTGAHEWRGYAPFASHPRIYNPPRGFIATSNNQIAGDWYPHYIAWRGASYRQERIEALLQGKERLSIDDFKAMQWDVTSTQPRRVVPLLLHAFDGRDAAAAVREALARVAAWRAFDFDRTLIAPTIYDAFYRRLSPNVFLDELGAELFARVRPGDVSSVLDRPDLPWFDDVRTAARETRDDVIVKSFTEAVTQLATERGPRQEDWTWGLANQTTIPHVAQSGRAGGGPFADLALGPFAKNGRSGWTVDPGGTDSYRMLVDLSNLDSAESLLVPGNSGRPDTPAYRDRIESWSRDTPNGAYHRGFHTREKAAATATRVLVLRPATPSPRMPRLNRD